MRQYAIFYKRGTGEFSRLNQNDHGKLIDHEEIRTAVSTMKEHSWMEGILVRLDDEIFNIISSDREALAPDAFQFDECRP